MPKARWCGAASTPRRGASAATAIPLLLQTPAARRFISYEPALGPVDFSAWLDLCNAALVTRDGAYDQKLHEEMNAIGAFAHPDAWALHQIIVGGESGLGARPFNVRWARDMVRQCKDVGVACFVKQMGGNVIDRNDAGFDAEWNGGRGWNVSINQVEDIDSGYQGAPVRVRLKDRKGGDMAEWPEDLRVREFPR